MEIINLIFSLLFEIIRSLSSSMFFWIMLILVSIVELMYPKFRGFMGEFWVRQELKKLPENEYKVLNDIMLDVNNKTHQIDHIVISKYGLFVIEMKNYYGKIYGDEFRNMWSQYIGKKNYKFNNPIHQNYGHVKALEDLLELSSNKFIPIVCFSNQAKLKITNKSIVVQLDYLIHTIRKYQTIILYNDIDDIYNQIASQNIKNKKERLNHIRNIRLKLEADELQAKNMICPKCGSKLIERKGKYGPFIGCTNYPKCKYIKKYKWWYYG